ncbi:MAG: hypothetical protein SF162_01105 [bacterium]|nr:hypothetical protein [bacterium]
MSQNRVVCPKCGRADAIRKVSSIVSAGTTQYQSVGYGAADIEGETHFVDTYSHGSASTGLANRLSAPRRPGKPWDFGCAAVLLTMRVGMSIAVLAVIGAVSICSLPLLYESVYRNSNWLILVPILIFAGAVIRLLWWIGSNVAREVGTIRRDRLNYPSEVERWELAIERWKGLYYCYRDDGVFLPFQTRLISIDDLRAFLYSSDKKKR